MTKIISYLVIGTLVSFFYFPIEFTFLPGINSKMILAALGVMIYFINAARGNTGTINQYYFILTAYAVLFSFICIISAVFNNTPDYTYATYFISMWVWIGAAYTTSQIIKIYHGELSIELIAKYLIGVCVAQCILALAIDMSPSFRKIVDSCFLLAQDFMRDIDRLYGIGAALDTAGVRFSIVMVLLAQLITTVKEKSNFYFPLYLVAFGIITIIGSMIARTTYVGVALAAFLILYKHSFIKEQISSKRKFYKWLFWIIIIVIPVVTYYYNNNANIHSNLRFAFEGFFNYIEKGEWQVDSNDRLESMIIWPDDLKTWIIGDGYFGNPKNIDPNYVGEYTKGNFYMGTDVGYCRFIFYIGIIGLAAFSLVIYEAYAICQKRFPSKSIMLLLILLLNFIVWMKVATDIFLIFALLMMADEEEQEEFTISDQLSQQEAMLEGFKRL